MLGECRDPTFAPEDSVDSRNPGELYRYDWPGCPEYVPTGADCINLRFEKPHALSTLTNLHLVFGRFSVLRWKDILYCPSLLSGLCSHFICHASLSF